MFIHPLCFNNIYNNPWLSASSSYVPPKSSGTLCFNNIYNNPWLSASSSYMPPKPSGTLCFNNIYNNPWLSASSSYVPPKPSGIFSPELNIFQSLAPRLDKLDRMIATSLTSGNIDKTILNTEIAKANLAIKNPFANVNSPTLIAKEHAELMKLDYPKPFSPIEPTAKDDDNTGATKSKLPF